MKQRRLKLARQRLQWPRVWHRSPPAAQRGGVWSSTLVAGRWSPPIIVSAYVGPVREPRLKPGAPTIVG